MHEYQLTMSIIEIAGRHAGKCERVKKISLVIGEMSGVSGEAIELYFEEIAQGTSCEGAVVGFETVKPMLKCAVCGYLFIRKPFSFACGIENCTGEGIPTEIGTEFYVKSVEIERKPHKWKELK